MTQGKKKEIEGKERKREAERILKMREDKERESREAKTEIEGESEPNFFNKFFLQSNLSQKETLERLAKVINKQ